MLALNGVGSLTAKLVKEQLLGVLFEIRVLKHVYDRCWLQAEVPKCADLRPVLALKPTSAPRR